MDYIKEITILRDKMHQEIINTIIVDNRLEPDEYEVQFKQPVKCTVSYYRPTINGIEDVLITGICGNSCELIAANEDGENRFIYYSDLKMEDLAIVHRSIITKNYITKQLELC
jgi:hypothetical protein